MRYVYVYHDADHGDVEVFDSFEKAVAYLRQQWGHKPQWEGQGDDLHDVVSDYVSVYRRRVW